MPNDVTNYHLVPEVQKPLCALGLLLPLIASVKTVVLALRDIVWQLWIALPVFQNSHIANSDI